MFPLPAALDTAPTRGVRQDIRSGAIGKGHRLGLIEPSQCSGCTTLSQGIAAVGDQPARRKSPVTRLGQREKGHRANTEVVAPAAESVSKNPAFRAQGGHMKIKAVTVSKHAGAPLALDTTHR
jgi:hypothetical protein